MGSHGLHNKLFAGAPRSAQLIAVRASIKRRTRSDWPGDAEPPTSLGMTGGSTVIVMVEPTEVNENRLARPSGG